MNQAFSQAELWKDKTARTQAELSRGALLSILDQNTATCHIVRYILMFLKLNILPYALTACELIVWSLLKCKRDAGFAPFCSCVFSAEEVVYVKDNQINN